MTIIRLIPDFYQKLIEKPRTKISLKLFCYIYFIIRFVPKYSKYKQ